MNSAGVAVRPLELNPVCCYPSSETVRPCTICTSAVARWLNLDDFSRLHLLGNLWVDRQFMLNTVPISAIIALVDGRPRILNGFEISVDDLDHFLFHLVERGHRGEH